MASAPQTRLLGEVELAFGQSLDGLDLKQLQLAFAELMDRTLPMIQSARLDQDEVLLERYAVVRGPNPQDASTRVPLPFIATEPDVRSAVERELPSPTAQGLQLERLIMAVRQELDPPMG